MNEKQISSIEKKCGVQLPTGFRQMLLEPPPLLAALLKFDAKENPGQTPLFTKPDMIIAVNQAMRDPEHEDYFGFDPNDAGKPWPDRYFIIGSDVGGNFYCIAPSTGKSRVYFWYQGDTAFSRFADNMEGFVKRIFRMYGEVAAMDCDDAE